MYMHEQKIDNKTTALVPQTRELKKLVITEQGEREFKAAVTEWLSGYIRANRKPSGDEVTHFVNNRFERGLTFLEELGKGVNAAFMSDFPHIKLGNLYRIADGAQYKITKAGNLVVITKIVLGSTGKMHPPAKPEVTVLALDKTGRIDQKEFSFQVACDDLVPVSQEEDDQIRTLWATPVPTYTPFADGTGVILKQDYTTVVQTMFRGAFSETLKAGTIGFIDVPDQNQGGDVNDLNKGGEYSPPTLTIKFGLHVDFEHECGHSLPLDFNNFQKEIPVAGYGWKYNVYVPDLQAHISVDRSMLNELVYNKNALDDVLLDEQNKRRIRMIVHSRQQQGALTAKATNISEKGRNVIAMLAGGPGLGKTKTAEAVSQMLGRPYFPISNAMLGTTPKELEDGLAKINERAKRWGAVFIWNECEGVLRKRSDDEHVDSEQDKRITAATNFLERFEGVMLLTSNMPGSIDPAILDRCNVKMLYRPLTQEHKAILWGRLTANLPMVDLQGALSELVKLPTNGRDIEGIIRSTAAMAESEGLTIITGKLLLEEANAYLEMARVMQNGEAEADLYSRTGDHKSARKALGNGVYGKAIPAEASAST
jgi:AAA+ superfamily predicted ATPase